MQASNRPQGGSWRAVKDPPVRSEKPGDPSTPLRSAQDDSAIPDYRSHFASLVAQGEALREELPGFDLDAALHDPAFLRLTAPGLGVGERRYLVRVSTSDGMRVLFLSPCTIAQSLLNDAFLYALRSFLMEMQVSILLLRSNLEKRGTADGAEEAKALLARTAAQGALRPREGGGLDAAALTSPDPRALSRGARERLRDEIRAAAARGEKLYP